MNYYYGNNNSFMPNYYQQPQYPTINGKVVDSVDTCKIQEVPLGGYGVFPKADLSEVYIKSWGIDGLTQITTYERKTSDRIDKTPELSPISIDFSEVLEAISGLNKKIDGLTKQSPVSMKKTTGGAKDE